METDVVRPSVSSEPRAAFGRQNLAPRSNPWRTLLRRWWLVVLCAVAVTAIASLTTSESAAKYRATAVYVIPVGGPLIGERTDLSNAARLGETYSILLPEDEALIDALAGGARIAPKKIRDGMRVDAVGSTPLLNVSFTGSGRDEVERFFAAFEQAMAAIPPPSPNVLPQSVKIVRPPSTVSQLSTISTDAVPLGLVLGVLLGLVGAFLLERADPRIDDDVAAETIFGVPTFTMAKGRTAGALAVMDDWRRLAKRRDPSVCLAGLRPSSKRLLPYAAHTFAGMAAAAGQGVVVLDGTDGHGEPGDTALRLAGPLNADGAAEREAQRCAVTVLVVPRGVPARDVAMGVQSLARFDLTPSWLLLTPRPWRAKTRSARPIAVAAPDDPDLRPGP
jgi:hypothetical protein